VREIPVLTEISAVPIIGLATVYAVRCDPNVGKERAKSKQFSNRQSLPKVLAAIETAGRTLLRFLPATSPTDFTGWERPT